MEPNELEGQEMNRKETPGRQTRPAHTRMRRSWYGYGKTANMEKSRFGCFLHDVVYIFGDISVLGLPVLMYIALTDPPSNYGATFAALVAWMTMVVVGTLIRGGWLRPVATETRGWVTSTLALIGLRLLYYNAVLFVAAYGGVVLARTVGIAPLSISVAAVVAILATLVFPRLGEEVACRWRRP